MWEWHNMGFGGGFMWFFWLLIIVAVVMLFKAGGQDDAPSDQSETALDLLEKRYARGEVDEDEFQRRKQALVKR